MAYKILLYLHEVFHTKNTAPENSQFYMYFLSVALATTNGYLYARKIWNLWK